jgi:hypothetical protein
VVSERASHVSPIGLLRQSSARSLGTIAFEVLKEDSLSRDAPKASPIGRPLVVLLLKE